MSEIFNDLFDSESNEHSEMYDILRKLISAEDDVDLKTEIKFPEKLAVLRLLGDEMEKDSLTESSNIIRNYVNYAFRHAFSKDRKSRSEIIESIKQLAQQENPSDSNQNVSLISKIKRSV